MVGLAIFLDHADSEPAPPFDRDAALRNQGFYLEDVARKSGVDFVHHGPDQLDAKLRHIQPIVAAMGASASIVDFDRDGWPDIFVTNGKEGSKCALYRNQHDGTFKDVAEEVGLADLNKEGTGVCMGAVWGDFDNDGYEDVLVYKWGRPMLFHNDAGKHFTDVTRGERPARLDERQQRPLVRLRPRRPARPVPRRLLARRPRPMASARFQGHARQFRVCRQWREQTSPAQRRPRSFHRRDEGDGHRQQALDAGRRRRAAVRVRLSRPVPGQRLRRLGSLRQSRRQKV